MSRPALALASTALLACLALGREGRADPPRLTAQAAPPPPAAQPVQPPAAQPPPPGYGAPPPGYGAPPPGYGAAPPGYGPPPPGYAPPPGYYYQPPPGYYAGAPLPPPVPKERNSPGMMVTGIVLTGVGVIALLSGAIVYTSANTQQTYDSLGCASGYCSYDDHDDEKTAGIAVMIAGGAAVAVGIPLLVIGARKVPVRGGGGAPAEPERRERDEDEDAEASLFVSPRATGLRMTF
jgi:hypothetical protein